MTVHVVMGQEGIIPLPSELQPISSPQRPRTGHRPNITTTPSALPPLLVFVESAVVLVLSSNLVRWIGIRGSSPHRVPMREPWLTRSTTASAVVLSYLSTLSRSRRPCPISPECRTVCPQSA